MVEYLEIGQIVNTHGIKGLTKVVPYTDDVTRFERLEAVLIEENNSLKQYVIEDVKYHKHMVLLKFKGIDTIEEAEKLKGKILKIDRKDAVELPKDSYFIVDLLGLEVYTIENEYLGKITDIFPTGSNDVYVVKNEEGKQVLIPALKTVVKKIDIENKRVEVQLIEGLI